MPTGPYFRGGSPPSAAAPNPGGIIFNELSLSVSVSFEGCSPELDGVLPVGLSGNDLARAGSVSLGLQGWYRLAGTRKEVGAVPSTQSKQAVFQNASVYRWYSLLVTSLMGCIWAA
jgi:hypothetical protein